MAGMPDWLKQEIEGLKQLRDEARLQLHLAQAESRQSFEQLEKRWQHLEARLRELRDASKSEWNELGESVKRLAQEIRERTQGPRKHA